MRLRTRVADLFLFALCVSVRLCCASVARYQAGGSCCDVTGSHDGNDYRGCLTWLFALFQKNAAKDAAEEAAGKDLDGDGKIGQRPITQPVAAPQAAPEAAARQNAAPAAGGAPALLSQLSKTFSFNNVVSAVRANAGRRVLRRPYTCLRIQPPSFTQALGQFKNMSPDVQSRATQATAQLDDGSHAELSRCTGKRKSLLIGINYPGTQAQLKGESHTCVRPTCLIDSCVCRRVAQDALPM